MAVNTLASWELLDLRSEVEGVRGWVEGGDKQSSRSPTHPLVGGKTHLLRSAIGSALFPWNDMAPPSHSVSVGAASFAPPRAWLCQRQQNSASKGASHASCPQ